MPFLAAPIAAIAGGGFITQLLVGTALTIGGTLLSQALAPKPPAQKDPGVSLSMQIGGDSPLSFIVGTSATAGHRAYAGTWGTDGETPNAFFVDVLELSNAPLDGLSEVYVNGEKATLLTGQAHAQYGIPIQQGRKGGKDHLWVKFYDGRQTVADPYLVAKFGGLAERPYDTDMVGRGTAYAIVTTRYNRELWKNGAPTLLFEVRGLRLYDIRKDSTAGGSGAHRRDNPATWEWTDNPYVIAYNVAFMGVYVGSEWLWGLQGLPALRLPTSAWVAAMNEADRTLAAWDNQKQFTIGGEITVDMEPAAVLEEIAKSSLGRFIESAGTYKPRCGLPGASVWSFGEGELLITEPRTFTPFPGLEATHNTIEATYSEPGEAWGNKAAPVQSNPAYIAADGNRRLAADLPLPMVNRNEQVQRLAYTYLEDGRRFRQFQASFHPISWLLEPGDVIEGTLLGEGYSGKAFEILEMSGRRTFVQTMTLREVDPSDFDPPSSAWQDWSVGPIQTIYPPAQVVTGWAVSPYQHTDNESRARRPCIQCFFQGGMDDIRAIKIMIRRPGEAGPFFSQEYPYDADNLTPSVIIVGDFLLPNEAYEVASIFVPFSGRDMAESDWLPVTTPDIRISQPDLDDLIRARIQQIAEQVPNDIGMIREQVDDLSATVNSQVATILERMGRINIGVGARYEENRAGVELAMDASATANSAIAQFLVDLFAVTPEGEAEVMFRAIAASLSEGVLANVALQVRAGFDGEWATAAMEMAALYNEDLGLHSRLRLIADQIDMKVGDVTLPMASVVVSSAPIGVPIVGGEITPDLTQRRQLYHTLLTDDAEFKPPIGASAGSPWVHMIEQDGTGGRVISADPDIFVGGAPEVAGDPGAVTILDGLVWNVAPPRIVLTARGSGLGGISLVHLGAYQANAGGNHTFVDVPIGEPRSDRIIVVVVSLTETFGYVQTWGTNASVSIGGTVATLSSPSAGGQSYVAIYHRVIPTGDKTDIQISHIGGGSWSNHISVYSIVRAESNSPHDDASNISMTSRTSVSVSLDIPDEGILIAGVVTPVTTINWTAGAIADYNATTFSSASASGLASESNRTITAQRASGSFYMNMVAASWS